MQYRPLGRTGIKVSPYCLGAMMFGKMANPDHDEAMRIIHRALDAGINFIDTADRYSAGESEEDAQYKSMHSATGDCLLHEVNDGCFSWISRARK